MKPERAFEAESASDEAQVRELYEQLMNDWSRDGKVAHFYEYVDTAVVSKAHTEAKTKRKAA